MYLEMFLKVNNEFASLEFVTCSIYKYCSACDNTRGFTTILCIFVVFLSKYIVC